MDNKNIKPEQNNSSLKPYKILLAAAPFSILVFISLIFVTPAGDPNIGAGLIVMAGTLVSIIGAIFLLIKGNTKWRWISVFTILIFLVGSVLLNIIFTKIDNRNFCQSRVTKNLPIHKEDLKVCQELYPNHQFELIN